MLAELSSTNSPPQVLLEEIKYLINQARGHVVSTVNQKLVLLNWKIGKQIKTEIVKSTRADYGDEIVATLSRQLQVDYGQGFTRSALFRMVQFYEMFPNVQIVVTLSQQLGWSHFVELIPILDPIKREFYTEICQVERWSVRVLRERIQSMLFERTVV